MMRVRSCLEPADFVAMAAACRAEADSLGIGVTIVIVDDSGYLRHLERTGKAQPISIKPAVQKAQSAFISGRPTKFWQDRAETGTTIPLPDILPLIGGVPIVVNGDCIGAIGVSGAKASEDMKVVSAGLSALGMLG